MRSLDDMDALKEPTRSDELTTERHPLLLFFDGECAFCNRWVNRVKAADHAHRIRYGTKQGQTFREVARAHPQLANVESIVLVKRRGTGGEDFLVRSAAIREIIDGLPGFGLFERLLKVVPLPISDLGYRFFSKLRTPLFGRLQHCPLPLEEEKKLYVQ